MDKPEKVDFKQVVTDLHKVLGSDEKIAARLNEEFEWLDTKKHTVMDLRTGRSENPRYDFGAGLVWLHWFIKDRQERYQGRNPKRGYLLKCKAVANDAGFEINCICPELDLDITYTKGGPAITRDFIAFRDDNVVMDDPVLPCTVKNNGPGIFEWDLPCLVLDVVSKESEDIPF